MLKFRTDTWHFKAYTFWHATVRENFVPTRTNLCSYTHGVLLGCLTWIISRFFKGFAYGAYTFIWPILALVGLLCGWLPCSFDMMSWKSYKPFLTMFGKPIHLMQIIAPVATACFLMVLMTILPISEHFILQGVIFFTFGSIPVLVAVLLYKISSIAITEYKKSHIDVQLEKEKLVEDPNLFIEMLKAKKQKICPVVEFNYDEQNDDR